MIPKGRRCNLWYLDRDQWKVHDKKFCTRYGIMPHCPLFLDTLLFLRYKTKIHAFWPYGFTLFYILHFALFWCRSSGRCNGFQRRASISCLYKRLVDSQFLWFLLLYCWFVDIIKHAALLAFHQVMTSWLIYLYCSVSLKLCFKMLLVGRLQRWISMPWTCYDHLLFVRLAKSMHRLMDLVSLMSCSWCSFRVHLFVIAFYSPLVDTCFLISILFLFFLWY